MRLSDNTDGTAQGLHTRTGNFREHRGFSSRWLAHDRTILVYLPPNYEDTDARYPVLYLHDGQNVFDAETAFAGQEWRVDETAEQLIRAGAIPPLIMVGIYNTGTQRMDEYTPARDAHGHPGGCADRYARMIIRELKPFIDREYRTLADPANTGMAGSSLGGLATIYIGLEHPEVFGKLAALSPSVWWGDKAILRFAGEIAVPRPRPKIWLDTGTAEGQDPEKRVHDARLLRDMLIRRGWAMGRDLAYMEAEGAGHNEHAWAARVRPLLEFLFGRDRDPVA